VVAHQRPDVVTACGGPRQQMNAEAAAAAEDEQVGHENS